MRRNLLGRTGLSVSVLSLGTVEIGMTYGLPGSHSRPTAPEAERLIQRALDAGINHLDTARAYGDSEAFIGAALGSRRSEVILTTKVLVSDDSAALTKSIETSLRFLRTDYVDILMLHGRPGETLTSPAMLSHLYALQAKGHFRYLGASVYGVDVAVAAIESGYFDCLQIAYSVLDRRPEEAIFALAPRHGVGLVARSILLKGALTPRYRDLPATYSELKAKVAGLDLLGIPLPELAYRYALAEPRLATGLAGTADPVELDQLLAYAELGPLPDDVVAHIRQQPLLGDHWLNPGLWPSG
ncbi:MAG: aldo/keto reductase [Bryobacteraceae bacterium]|nr:aldo/keto reductase [Bryobacteraceae bacterium]